MIKAASLPITVDLYSFSKLLSKRGLAHRINEESGYQVIWVRSEEEALFLREALAQWQEHAALSQDSQDHSKDWNLTGSINVRRLLNGLIASVYVTPVTMFLFSVCIVVAGLSKLGANPSAVASLFYPALTVQGLMQLILSIDSPAQLLQTLTPMFLHFGELHLVFNMLWLWYFGKQLEAIHPSWLVAVLVIVIAFVSNTAQFMMSESRNFGGMSGVVYGLMAYAWVIHSAMPQSYLSLNKNLLTFFVIALVAMELIASSMIATAAHVGGLLSGLALGAAAVVVTKTVLKTAAVGSKPARIK